jgi:uncharacterized BrkB/YihY/UPF0761 family membrane protein
MGDLVERARLESERAREYAEDARARSPFVELGFSVFDRDRARLGGLLSGALAYRFFIYLLPFTLLLVGLLGAVTAVVGHAPEDLSDQLGMQGVLADLIIDGGQQKGWWIALIVGLFGTAWAGLGTTRALRVSHAAAWGIRPPPAKRPHRWSLGIFLLGLGIVVAQAFATWLRGHGGLVGHLFTVLVMALLYFVVWLRVSSILPHRDVPLQRLVPGAALMAVGAQGLSLFTVYYLSDSAERATSVYGAIGAALAMLLWLFILARLIVGSAMLNAELAAEAARRPAG